MVRGEEGMGWEVVQGLVFRGRKYLGISIELTVVQLCGCINTKSL